MALKGNAVPPPLIARVANLYGSSHLARLELGCMAAALLLSAYVALLVRYSALTLQDYPNHLARALVLQDLIFQNGAHFGTWFQYHFLPTPYIVGDLLLATAIEFFGVPQAAALWSIVSFLSLPCALLYYLRTTAIGNEGKLLLLLLSLYLATDWFFLMGFLEFRLGIALTLVIFAEARRFRNQPSLPVWIGYGCLLIVGYLTHLTTLLFATVQIAGTALVRLYRRDLRLSTELWLAVPCVILLAFHLGIAAGYRQAGDLVENPYLWGPVQTKVSNLAGELYRYGARTDAALFALLACCVVIYLGPPRKWRRDAMQEPLVLATLMLMVYIALPRAYSEAYFVDVRALPWITLFVLLGLVSAADSNSVQPAGHPALALGLAAVLAAINLLYLAKHFSAQSRWLLDYRAVAAMVPERSRVLPIYTQISDGRVFPFRHAFSFALIDRGALVPYLQTGDTGNAQKYIRYSHRPYAPAENWYNEAATVDWSRIACEYNFILATEPFDAQRLPVQKSLLAQNESAALFALPSMSPRDCARANRSAFTAVR